MVTINEIAKYAGVSASTTSFILNGKAEQMRISEKTKKKVLEVANELGYSPNIQARRLRSNSAESVPVIAVLWTMDTRVGLLAPFLSGIQKFSAKEKKFELVIETYESGKLDKHLSMIEGNKYNAAIIANASLKDQEFLEQTNFKIPIVVYQRTSQKHHTVGIDSFLSGEKVAHFFLNQGLSDLGLVVPNVSSQAVSERQKGFEEACDQQGIKIGKSNIYYGDFSEEGGYLAVKEMLKGKVPAALFFLSDQMAMGGLKAFSEADIDIPNKVQVIGYDNTEYSAYTIPSMSTLNLPVSEMAEACIKLLLDALNSKPQGPIHKKFPSELVLRETTIDVTK